MFKGRDSTGVRGISLGEGDHVISMAVIRHFDAASEERAAYLKMSRAVRGEGGERRAGRRRGRGRQPAASSARSAMPR